MTYELRDSCLTDPIFADSFLFILVSQAVTLRVLTRDSRQDGSISAPSASFTLLFERRIIIYRVYLRVHTRRRRRDGTNFAIEKTRRDTIKAQTDLYAAHEPLQPASIFSAVLSTCLSRSFLSFARLSSSCS